jgi:hypothetical protein
MMVGIDDLDAEGGVVIDDASGRVATKKQIPLMADPVELAGLGPGYPLYF